MKLSVITPSYNQAAFVERTVRSVLSQRGDFELEYLVVDGGSRDGALDILRRYEGQLRLVAEPDRGQCDAINKGFRMATGEVVAWLNSDDVYAPGALDAVVRTFRETGARWCFGECKIVDEADRPIRGAISAYKAWVSRRYSVRRLLARNFIPQPAVFFRRELLEAAGPLDESLRYAMDYDLWLRFARLAEPVFVPRPLAAFRWHARSVTGAGYARGAWECLAIARRRARGLERVALAKHLLHAAAEVAVYRTLDWVRSARPSSA
ncbi:MAG TPA: glycosyltransferase family 2 protein [Anaeromyxobacter sp.]|jgi:glycosyltransferase involved in cell wall biosynthesis|nr:glycosyltransferase family 2 protein [Anaeromyxobacter sp.]